MAERSGCSVVMEFSPSEVFIPHIKESLLQPLALVAYVAVRGGDGGGRGRPGTAGVLGSGQSGDWHLRRNNDGQLFGSLEP